MTLYMETTKIAAEKTAQEIGYLLGQAGARAIQTEYKDRKVSAMSFCVRVKEADIPFRLPIRTEPIFEYLQKRRSPMYRGRKFEQDQEQAERVAWRQVFRWVQAQLALIDTGMVRIEEVFLPYFQVGIDETLFQRLESGDFQGRLQLPLPLER